MTFTSADLRDQVVSYLGNTADDYDVSGIVNEIQAKYGTVDIDTIDGSDFMTLVSRFDITGDIS